MVRDKALVPLSHQHQHALALCVMVRRGLENGSPAAVEHWEGEVERMFAEEMRYHFAAEEAVLFPAAQKHPHLGPLVEELRAEHERLRAGVAAAAAHRLGADGLRDFAGILSEHVRKEERQLFEEMQRLLLPEQLAALGAAVNEHFPH